MSMDEFKKRIHAGFDKARAKGIKIGRPALPQDKVMKIIELQDRGWSAPKIAKHLNLSPTTVYRYLPLE